MSKSIFWDLKIKDKRLKSILTDDSHPRFIEFAPLLLSRTNDPRWVFRNFISKEIFCQNWQRIKKRMRKNQWGDQRILFWDEIYRVLREKIKIVPREESSPEKYLSLWIGRKIKDVRTHKRWTQKYLAQKSKVSQQLISFIEGGKVNISLDTLFKILKALDLTLNIEEKNKESRITESIGKVH